MRIRLRLAVAATLAVSGLMLSGTPAMAAADVYVALGDSYASGVGTREYYPDSGDCKRSPHAYAVLDAPQLGAELKFDACSGAKTGDVLNNQLGNLNDTTRYVSLSIGGNDAGFVPVITECAKPWPYTCWEEIDAAKAFIQNELPGKLDEVYSAIGSRAPNARVAIVGYPRLFNGEQCNVVARISPEEQRELNATADLLADVTAKRAADHGFAFVDPRDAFTGHAVCDDAEWLNGVSNPIGESYHPNRAGHSAGFAPMVKSALSESAPLP